MKRVLIAAILVMVALSQFGCANSGMSRAAIYGDLQAVKECASKGEKVNDVDKWGWTPLMWSVYYGNLPVTKWLLDNGADPDMKSRGEYGNYLPGTTALILAAAYGRDEAVAALLAKNADPAIVDRKGKTALDYAREHDFDKVVAMLKK